MYVSMNLEKNLGRKIPYINKMRYTGHSKIGSMDSYELVITFEKPHQVKVPNILKNFERLIKGSCKNKIQSYNGIGTMLAFAVGDCSRDTTKDFLMKLLENGIVAFMAGADPVKVRLLIPATLTDDHVEGIFKIIEKI